MIKIEDLVDPLWVANYIVGKGRDLEPNEALARGDLLYWSPRIVEGGHVAIYLGNWRYIEAAGKEVRTRSLIKGSGVSPSRFIRVTSQGDAFVRAALRYLGVPYRLGGRDRRSGIDCYGLVLLALAGMDGEGSRR